MGQHSGNSSHSCPQIVHVEKDQNASVIETLLVTEDCVVYYVFVCVCVCVWGGDATQHQVLI